MQRVRVGFGEDGDGTDTHAVQGADDPAGDHAAICYQDFFKHLAGWRWVPNQQPYRSWIVTIARIVELGTIADEREHIYFRSHLYIFPRLGDSVFEGKLAFGG